MKSVRFCFIESFYWFYRQDFHHRVTQKCQNCSNTIMSHAFASVEKSHNGNNFSEMIKSAYSTLQAQYCCNKLRRASVAFGVGRRASTRRRSCASNKSNSIKQMEKVRQSIIDCLLLWRSHCHRWVITFVVLGIDVFGERNTEKLLRLIRLH